MNISTAQESAKGLPNNVADINVGAFPRRPYELHGMRVVDRDGHKVGYVDWFWTGEGLLETGFIGVRLQWLRGKAIAVPAAGMQIDVDSLTVRVPYRKAQIVRAGRFPVTRPIAGSETHSIHAYFGTEGRGRERPHRPEGKAADALRTLTTDHTSGVVLQRETVGWDR